MKKVLRMGTRPSRLAMRQAEEIGRAVPSVKFKIVPVRTKGDEDKITPISRAEGSDFFTREIEAALLSGGIDAAVHSAKDLEEAMPEGLIIAATTRSISPYECLVSRSGRTLRELPPGSVLGTSSRKRGDAIRSFRPDLVIKDIRGDIEERLARMDKGEFDAIIIAHAALIRLGIENRGAEIISPEIAAPHPLQGRLAVQVRKDRSCLIKLFRSIDGQKTW